MTLLSQQQIDAGLQKLSGWTQQGPALVKDYKVKDFSAALKFINAAGEKAEAADHHPDILLHSYNKVRMTLSTHSAGGITQKDFDLAGQIDSALP